VMLFALFTKFGGVKSALTTLIVGTAVWATSHYLFHFELSYILALGASIASYLFVGFVERRVPSLTQPEVEIQK